MVKAAELHAKEDKERRDAVEARNHLDGLVYKVEKDSKEWVDRLAGDVKERLDKAVETGQEALRVGDPAGIRTALDELNQAYSAAGASLYSQQQASQQAEQPTGEAQPGGQAKEEVVEADYEIVDEKKKQ